MIIFIVNFDECYDLRDTSPLILERCINRILSHLHLLWEATNYEGHQNTLSQHNGEVDPGRGQMLSLSGHFQNTGSVEYCCDWKCHCSHQQTFLLRIAHIQLLCLENIRRDINHRIAINSEKVHIFPAKYRIIDHEHLPNHNSPPYIEPCPTQMFFKWVVYIAHLLCQVPHSENGQDYFGEILGLREKFHQESGVALDAQSNRVVEELVVALWLYGSIILYLGIKIWKAETRY